MVAKLADWVLQEGDGPLIAVAIHHGHELRPEVAAATQLSDADRLREEDPYTGLLAQPAPTHLIALRSRFEVDLNRAPDGAVYLGPEQAWGLDVWKSPPTEALLTGSMDYCRGFYAAYRAQVERLLESHESILVLDLHSYNHRRSGPDAPVDDPAVNPDINLGTGSLDHSRFGAVARTFVEEMSQVQLQGISLDVRENVKFRGGHLVRWTHEQFPGRVCALAVEFKKIFMDEWTGVLHEENFAHLKKSLWHRIPALLNALP